MSASPMRGPLPNFVEPSRTVAFANRLNALIGQRERALIDAETFDARLSELGISESTRSYLRRSTRVTKSAELIDEYEVCEFCRDVDGNHFGDCETIN